MKNIPIFRRTESWAKQKDIAIMTIAKLKSTYQVEHPCEDYASAKAMAELILRNDKYNEVNRIEVYQSFVRLIRNEKGAFAFPAVIVDNFAKRIFV